MKKIAATFSICVIHSILFSQNAPEKSFVRKLEGVQTSSKELTKSASTDNSSVGQGGVMSTSVPLVTVKSRQMEFPIQLNYSSGIKTDQVSSSVGLGWVMPVGSIVRDYGAFQPDYTSTLHEGDMWNQKYLDYIAENPGETWLGCQKGCLNPTPFQNTVMPFTHNRELQYNLVPENQRNMPLSDFYHASVPGLGNNTFWNGGTIGGSHAWKWNEVSGWQVKHDVKTYVIDQEYSRINEMNLGLSYLNDKNQFDNSGSHAVAIGMLPYVKNSFVGGFDGPHNEVSKVHYEDFKEFTIVDENGTMYVFGRGLRGQKFIFQEDPYWSTTENAAYYQPGSGGPANSPRGSYWKTDFIAEWLLTEIRSADYQDLNGNGIADDGDAGDWIRFEYTEPTKKIETVPLGSFSNYMSTVPKHREWQSFSQTDEASSLMRERAYLTRIVTPAQELVFTTSKRYDVEHDYYAKPANKIGTLFYYEDRKASLEYGDPSDFDVYYPVETMKYDSISVYSRLIDKLTYTTENTFTGLIRLNYAAKGSNQELAVSDFLIRNNNDAPKLTTSGKHLGAPSNSGFSISDYNNGTDKRGKTTLLSVDFYDETRQEQKKNSYMFEYGYNPSFNEIHKREIVRKWSSPSLRASSSVYGPSGENIKGNINILYTEQILGSNGMSYTSVNHTGIANIGIPTYEFLIDIPYHERHYKQVFPSGNELAGYVTTSLNTGTALVQYPLTYEEINRPLQPVKDVYGYLYAPNCTKCPEAWSLTKIIYPTGGEISFGYELGEFELNEDKSNWSFDNQSIPMISEYNGLARHRSAVQDAFNRRDIQLNKPGIGVNNRRKTLTATFEVDLPDYYGIRLKSKTTNDRINPEVVVNYEYGDGHFTSCPSEYVQSVFGNFNSFVMRELYKNNWEFNNYGNTTGEWTTDYREKMKYAAISDLSLDGYESVHFYETISAKHADNSYSKLHYGPVTGNNIPYGNYNLLCYKLKRAGFDGAYILGGNNITLPAIGIKKTEFFDASSPTLPYKVITNNYERISITTNPFTVDYTGGTSNPNTMTIWSNAFEVWTTALIAMTNTYAFGYYPGTLVTKSFSLPYNGNPVYGYERWGSHQTILSQVVNNYKGMITTNRYTYNDKNQLKKEEVSGEHTDEKYITTYEYANETYSTLTTEFQTRNMLHMPTRVTTYLDEVLPANTISSQMQTYNYTSFSVPRPLTSYQYETNTLNSSGTFTLVPFDILSASNPGWRKTEQEFIEYNKQGGLVSSKTNQLYGKTVYGNNNNLPKAQFVFPDYAFDATYTGFEDISGSKSITSSWTPESYLNETWFSTVEEEINEPAFSVNIQSNPCGLYVPPGVTNYPMSRYLNAVTIDNINNLTVGDAVRVELLGNNNSIPVNYSASFETTITAIFNTAAHYPNPTSAIEAVLKDYIVCFSDPIIYPGSSIITPIGVDQHVDENAFSTISQTKLIKKSSSHFRLNKSYKRTGNYSCQLQTKRNENQLFTRTPVRPVKTKAQFRFACVPSVPGDPDVPFEPIRSTTLPDDCFYDYEASVWLLYNRDIRAIGIFDPPNEDVAGNSQYRRGTVTESNNGSQVKIICDIYNEARTQVIEQHIFYPVGLDGEWKQYTVNFRTSKQTAKWIDVYIINEREQINVSVRNAQSLFVDDLLVYPKGAKYTYNTYNKYAAPTFATNNNDVFTETKYDSKARVAKEINAYTYSVKEYSYFDTPLWSSQNNYVTERTKVTNSQYHETRYYMDGFAKIKQTVTSDPVRNLRIFSGTTVYDNKGNATRSYKPYALNGATLGHRFNGEYAVKTNELYATHFAFNEYTYEAKPESIIASVSAPRMHNETPFISNQTDFTNTEGIQNLSLGYSFSPGELLVYELKNPDGVPVRTYIDNLGRAIMEEHMIGKNHVQDPEGVITFNPISPDIYARTWFVYNKANRLTDIYDPEGKRTSYQYNSLGWVMSADITDKGKIENRYDKYGQIRFSRNQKDMDASLLSGKPQFKYSKYDTWGRVTESGAIIANASCTSCPSADWFNDISRVNDQEFPATGTKQVQVHQRNKYDGKRSTFDSRALLKETTISGHILQSNFTFSETIADTVGYAYMEDGQLKETSYFYHGLSGKHVVKQNYNILRIPVGKEYIHPTDSRYNFTWNNDLDNFARPTLSRTIHNSSVEESGRNYYDLLGNVLYNGIGKTGNPVDPHIDYMVFRKNIREEVTDMRSKTLRIGLQYDKVGNIIRQQWSNEHFDPSSGTMPVPVNVYDYYYDKMNRLIGADYQQGTLPTNNFFGHIPVMVSKRPDDFTCGTGVLLMIEHIQPFYAELDLLQTIPLARDAKQVLEKLESFYIDNDMPYDQMSSMDKEMFLSRYMRAVDQSGMTPASFELYQADKYQDSVHKELLTNGSPFTTSHLKYTKSLLNTLPATATSVTCQTNQGAVVYGFMPTLPPPSITWNADQYDAAYWYQKNGNITKLNRNDHLGVKTEQTYTYSNTNNNTLSSVNWTRLSNSQTHAYTYDAVGNLLTDPRNGVTNINYNSYNDLPQSITNTSGTKKYRYNSQGIRLVKENTSSDRDYYIDGVVLNGSGVVKSYQTVAGYAVPHVSGSMITMDYFYYLKDWLGTIRGVLDSDGNTLNANDHYPYGLRLPIRSFITDSEGERYQFTGHEFDAETSYDYHGARYYNRELGRYMSTDPWQDKYPGWSTYTYVMGNPIMLIDPTGKGAEGDYFDWNNNYLGTDGLEDGKQYNIHREAWDDVSSQYEGKQKGENFKSTLANYGATEKVVPSPYLKNGNYSNGNQKNETHNNASSFSSAAGNVTTAYDAVQAVRGKQSPPGLKGVGIGLTIVDGVGVLDENVKAIEEFQNTGNSEPLKKAAANTGVFIFETAVVDRALTSGNPYAMAGGVLYYVGKFLITGTKEGDPPMPRILTEEEKIHRYNDNLHRSHF